MTRNFINKQTINLTLLVGSVFLLMGFSGLAKKGLNILNWSGNSDAIENEVPAYLQKKYLRDATRLALRLISEDSDYDDLEAEVPEALTGSIYSALVRVYQSDIEAAKIVTRNHKLHTFPVPSVDHFFVIYDRTARWATPLRLGDNSTNDEKINTLLERYGLVIDKHVEWDEEKNSFHVKATKSLNIAAIAKEFSRIDGVVLVDLLMPDGDGNDIEIRQLGDVWEIDYQVKFDSCLTGCKSSRIWTFQVSNGEVTFIGEKGDELPDWMR